MASIKRPSNEAYLSKNTKKRSEDSCEDGEDKDCTVCNYETATDKSLTKYYCNGICKNQEPKGFSLCNIFTRTEQTSPFFCHIHKYFSDINENREKIIFWKDDYDFHNQFNEAEKTIETLCKKNDVLVYISTDSVIYTTKSHHILLVKLNEEQTRRVLYNPVTEQKKPYLFATEQAFAALFPDGNVVTWGSRDYGGQRHLTGVTQLYSSSNSFFALTKEKKVIEYGMTVIAHGGKFEEIQKEENSKDSKISLIYVGGNKSLDIHYGLRCYPQQEFKDLMWGSRPEHVIQANVDEENVVYTLGAAAVVSSDGGIFVWGNTMKGGSFQK